MIIYSEMIQQTPEWFAVKKGKMSASHATAIGNCGKGLETYCRQIVRDMIVETESYSNKDMERGNELEPIARITYELENNCIVKQVGFIEHSKFVGYSPDGLVNEDGLIELKARNNDIHFGLLLGDPISSDTIWQMNMGMLVSGRKWCDFGSYNPNFKQSLFVKRFYPDQSKIDSLLEGFKKGEQMITQLLSNENIKLELLDI